MVRLVAGAGMVGVAAAAAAPVFGGWTPGPLLTVLGGVALPAAVVGLVTALRRPPVLRLLTALAALAAYVLLVVAPGRSLVDGPRRLLTVALPADPTGPELAAVVLTAGLAALWSAHLAVRPSRPTPSARPAPPGGPARPDRPGRLTRLAPPDQPGRSRPVAALAPAVPALVLLGLVLAVGAGAGSPPGWVVPALVGLAGLLLVSDRLVPPTESASGPTLGGASTRPPRRWTALLAPAAVLAAVAVLAAQLGPSAPLADLRAEPFDARSLVDQPVPPREDVTPLTYFPTLRTGDRPLDLEVRTAARDVRWIRMVTLPVFTGQTWTTAATYQRAGRRLPADPDRPNGTVSRVTADITVRGTLGWLPTPDRAVAVTAEPAIVGVDTGTGDLVVSRDGPALSTYRVTTESVRPDAARLPGANPVPASAEEQDVTVIGAEVRGRALEVGRGTTAFRRIAAVRAYLRGRPFRLATGDDAPGGSGSFAVAELLRTKVGTAEQYASAFALMLRSLGYRTRVVMGFRPGAYDPGFGGYRLDGSTVDVKAEVHFAGLGWVPFDATPSTRDDGTAPPPAATPPDPR